MKKPICLLQHVMFALAIVKRSVGGLLVDVCSNRRLAEVTEHARTRAELCEVTRPSLMSRECCRTSRCHVHRLCVCCCALGGSRRESGAVAQVHDQFDTHQTQQANS